jgi:hypothetical protein
VEPDLTALEQLEKARAALISMSDAEVIDGLAVALELWRGPDGYAAWTARELAESRGSSEEMLVFGLDRMLSAHTRNAISQWLSESRVEAGRLIASCHPDGDVPVLGALRGPGVIAQVLAGNVAGLAIPAALEALLARSAVLLKPASGDPVTANLLKESLDRADPRLGTAVAVRSWSGGDESVEAAVFSRVDYVIASGGKAMSVSLHERLQTPHRIYGPRFSIGVVGMDWLSAPDVWWEEVVREIVLWDQQGCLSPRVLFVGGDQKRFAGRLAEAFRRWQTRWPARPLSADEASAVHGFRSLYQMADGTKAGCIDPGDTSWTVVWDSDPTLDTGPPARVARVTSRLGKGPMEALLTAHHGEVQGMGTAFLTSNELEWKRRADWGEVARIVPLTEIQDPPAGWRADGRSGLTELLAHASTS